MNYSDRKKTRRNNGIRTQAKNYFFWLRAPYVKSKEQRQWERKAGIAGWSA